MAFASPEWVNFAKTVIEELVAKHGQIGDSFSVCEVFTDAPEGLAGPDKTTAAWHFSIQGKTVTVGEGEKPDADMMVKVDYKTTLPMAKFVYTPEMLEKMKANPTKIKGKTVPSYLGGLHNQLAAVTQ